MPLGAGPAPRISGTGRVYREDGMECRADLTVRAEPLCSAKFYAGWLAERDKVMFSPCRVSTASDTMLAVLVPTIEGPEGPAECRDPQDYICHIFAPAGDHRIRHQCGSGSGWPKISAPVGTHVGLPMYVGRPSPAMEARCFTNGTNDPMPVHDGTPAVAMAEAESGRVEGAGGSGGRPTAV